MAPSGTNRFPDLENIDLDTKIVSKIALVLKLWSKTDFYKILAKVTCSSTSDIETA